MKKNSNIKVILIVAFLLLILIFTYLILKNKNKNEENSQNEIENTTNNEVSKKTIIEEENLDYSLKKITDDYDYFLTLNCLKAYYDFLDYDGSNLQLIDTKVIEELKLNENNFLNIETKGYCIDEIYKQDINKNEKIYVVYFRIGTNSSKVENRVVWIRINDNNKVFYIYPYEYLSKNNYLNLKANNIIKTDKFEEIEDRKINKYEEEDILLDKTTCMQEVFSKYKFDLLMDRKHLYNTLDEKYRNAKFKTFEQLEQYIEENKSELYLESIKEFNVSNYDTYKQYSGTGTYENIYIFDVENMMQYTLRLDIYSIITDDYKETYDMLLPNVKGKYCIGRIIEAINNKDYEFIYEKLDPIQKSNYYSKIEDLITYIQTYFWEKNDYEFEESYMISPQVYQYTIKIKDKGGLPGYRLYTATVTLKNEEDFYIALKMN